MSNATAREQYMLELVNRARLDPLAEAARLGVDLNQGLAPGTISAASKQPLAMNDLLINSARTHDNWMLQNDIFSHTGAGNSTPGDRMAAAGYSFTGTWTWGENISWRGVLPGPIDLSAAIPLQHDSLFRSAGHRTSILSDTFREIGVGQQSGNFLSSGTDWSASMVTQNFALSGSSIFVTGVAYNDTTNDDFYGIGEGVGGVNASAGALARTTGVGGGYELGLAAGTHTVNLGATSFSITLSSRNAKVDLVDGNQIWTSSSLTLISGATEAHVLGIDATNLTGGAGNETLYGNAAANALTGGAGNDTLFGNGGADSLDGGLGNDILQFDIADIVVQGGGGTDRGVFNGATAGLRAYDMAARGLEILDWTTNGNAYRMTLDAGGLRTETVTDTANSEATFASRTTIIDALQRIELEDVRRDDGLRVITDYDAANAAGWSQIIDSFDALARRDFQDTRYDNGARVIYDTDQANGGAWASVTTTYDAAAAVDYQDTRYDNASRVIFDGDQASAFNWTSITTTYAASSAVDYQDYQYDDGRRVIFDGDQDNAFAYASVTTSYATGGAADVQDTTYDDGRRIVFDWDNASAFTWLTWQTEFSAGGVLTRQVITYDDGTVVII